MRGLRSRVAPVLAAIWIAALVTPRAAAPGRQADAPAVSDVEGAKLISTLCGSCHARGSVLAAHRSHGDWEEILEWMIDEGAVMSDEELARVLAYLSVAYGRVAVNRAPADEIRLVLELTAAQADRLAMARATPRRFSTTRELAEAAGVPMAFVEARVARIDFD